MLSFKITSSKGREYEGLASTREVLNELIERKISNENISGKVEIFSGKKVIEEYEV